MAIGQTIYSTRLPVQQLNHPSTTLIYPFGGLAEAYLLDDKRPTSKSPNRREVKASKRTHNDMTKGNISYGPMSTPRATAANRNATASGSRVVTSPARPTDVASTSRQEQHRRKSSQSLMLDLEGLDLGQGVRSAGGLEQQPKEEVPWNRRSESRQRGRFRANTATPKLQEEPPKEQEKHVEDSFFAHLRKCEDSYDILDTAQTLSMSSPSQSDDLGKQTATQQVLGGFASLGYSGISHSQTNILDVDPENSPYSSVPVSPHLGGSRKTRKLPWKTLVPILHDPMSTLDILSIEEMGLHSIDVGSSKEWEGFSLAYPSGSRPLVESGDNIKTAQWTVAKSNKKQKKWIVAPDSLSASRTVIVSGHIDSDSKSRREAESPRSDTPTIFVCQASFDLRFLRPGKGSPSLTTTLTNPAAHRAAASRSSLQLSSVGSNEIGSLHSLGIYEEQASSAAVSVHNLNASIQEESDVTSPASSSTTPRPPLGQSKSSSTIQTNTVPKAQQGTRRPSLVKSVSHESLTFHSPKLDDTRRVSRASMATVTNNDSATIKGHWQASSPSYEPPIVVNDTAIGELAFADYSMALKGAMDPSRAASAGKSSTSSPRSSSVQRDASLSGQREEKNPIPILSTIDSGRLAEYHRLSSDRNQNAFSSRFQDASWQQGTVANARPLARKDRRLSEWIKKKVLQTGTVSPPAMATPLPAAWEQQRDVHSVVSTSSNRSTAKAAKTGKPIKSYSNVSKSSGSSQVSRGDSYPSIVGSPHTFSQASLSSTLLSEVEDKEQGRPINMAAATPLSHMQIAAQGHNVWPGVLSQRNERRRSNSDDHLLTMSEAAKRRLETMGKESNTGSPIAGADWQDEDDSSTKLSLSMPSQSVLSTYGDLTFNASTKVIPMELLDLENVPNKSMTMVVPLPMGKRSDQSAARYIRISYVPFGADHQSGSEDSDRESCDEGGHGASQASLPPWYKRFTHALSTGARSSSPGSNEDSEASDEVALDTKGVAESFRIIAKILVPPNQKKSPFKDYSLPHATPFPVILGWCDQQRSVKLVPEGWQAIGLANGPADADSPLGGLADLVMAGAAACMEL